MTTHTDLINYIAGKMNSKRYLEIGVFDMDHNFNKINVPDKVCVDPDPNAKAIYQCTSDFFFETINKLDPSDGGGVVFDLIFVDGLHHADQVHKDIMNAWECLKTGGIIVIHDSNPPTEKTICIPRGNQREWCGDVYKAVCSIENFLFTVDFDYGCAVILKTAMPLILNPTEYAPDWKQFNAMRKELLTLVTVEQAMFIIDHIKDARYPAITFGNDGVTVEGHLIPHIQTPIEKL